QRRGARAPEVGDKTQLGIRYVTDQHAVGVGVLGQVSGDLALAIRDGVAIGDFDHDSFAQVARREIRVTGERHRQYLAEVLSVALADYKSCTGSRVGAQTTDMIHMVMGEHQVFNGLARILRLCRSNGPVRLPVAHWRVEHYQGIAQLDNQAI